MCHLTVLDAPFSLDSGQQDDLIAASIHATYLVGPSIRPFCTMPYMIQVCSNLTHLEVDKVLAELGLLLGHLVTVLDVPFS